MARRSMEWKSISKWRPIQVKENMSRDVQTVVAETGVMDVARIMRDQHVGSILVEENGKMIGIITDRDIACRVTAGGLDPGTTTAKAIMTGDIDHCFEDDSLTDAAKIMMAKRVHRLPVFNRDEDLVGLLTTDDLAWRTDHVLVGEVVEAISEEHE